MTVSSTTRKAGPFTGNDLTTVFPFTFKVFAKTDLRVILTDAAGAESDLVVDADFTAFLNSDQDNDPGGAISYSYGGVPLSSAKKLTILSAVALLQPVDIVNGAGFYPSVVEGGLDRVVILAQQVKEILDRAIVFAVSDTPSTVELPAAEERANKALVFDDDGNIAVSTAGWQVEVTHGNIIRTTHVKDVDFFAGGTTLSLPSAAFIKENVRVLFDGAEQQQTEFSLSGATITLLDPIPADVEQIETAYIVPLAVGEINDGVVTDDKVALNAAIDANKLNFVQAGAGTVARTARSKMREAPVTPDDFGAAGNGVTDDYTAFQNWAAHLVSTGSAWLIPEKNYLLNGAAPIVLKTSGVCLGSVSIPKTNTTCRIEIRRDDVAGTVLNTAGWSALVRGETSGAAISAANKTLFMLSTEILMERTASTPYYKQEMITCEPSGNFSTALVCTYTSFANLTVTAFTPSRPIRIDGLKVIRTGSGSTDTRGAIVVSRDCVTLNNPEVLNDTPATPLQVGIEVLYCSGVTINSPVIRGGLNYGGVGYGIAAYTTIGLTVNSASLSECRHAFSGRHNVDVVINGGAWGLGIDDHWGDRMVINNPVMRIGPGGCAIQYAGNDITINDPVVFGGRTLLGIREDTPSLGGKVLIKNPRVVSLDGSGNYWMFGFTASTDTIPSGGPYTNKPTMPDVTIIEDPYVRSDASVIFGAKLSCLLAAHTTWGTVEIRGVADFGTTLAIGVFAIKDSTYAQDRSPKVVIDGPMSFNTGGYVAYITALDAVVTRNYDVKISGVTKGDLRFSPYSTNSLEATHSSLGTIENDDGTEPFTTQRYVIRGCTMTGGVVRDTFRNFAFMGNVFAGATYTMFPGIANVTMIGNTRTTAAGFLPADIRANVVAPYA